MGRFPLKFGFSARVAIFYVALCGTIGVHLPFFPLWLKAKALDPQLIGIVLAAPQIVRIVAIPLATRIADRRDALRGVLLSCALGSLAGYILLVPANDAAAILLLFALASAFYTPMMPLADTYALRGLGARQRAYGPVRLWGSVSFVVGMMATGVAADLIAARHLIWIIVAAIFLTVAAAATLEPLHIVHLQPTTSRRKLLREPTFLAVLIAASLIQASHAVYYGFSTLDWSRGGFDGVTIAALWAIGVIAEIVLFAFQSRLPKGMAPGVLLIAGGVGGALRWTVMALDPPSLLLPWLQILHGLSFGATHLGTMGLITQHAPVRQAATAQGYLAIALGLAMAAAMALSGWLYAAYGDRAYAAMALIAAAGGVGAVVANKLRPRGAL
ncbi:MAG: MFS transporter [Pseudolabrys sp.]|nr:MFS transporter [Pseudolabrys sp.]